MNEDIFKRSQAVIEGRSDSLDLSGLGLITIPEFVYGLKNIKKLDISNNNIETIPPELVRIPTLQSLILENNPISNPPVDILINGLDTLRKYYDELENIGVSKLYEAKVVIIGEGGAGKTSFARKFIDINSQLPEPDESTKGIEITPFFFLNQDNERFRLNIWDFGGQEIYHATHQFFLSKRTLYVLVADSRSESPNFNYWLNIANVLGGSSPLIILLNEKGDRYHPIDEVGVKSRFANVCSIVRTNMSSGRGVKSAIDEVKFFVQKLSHIGDFLPRTWLDIRNNLEHRNTNKIKIEDFFKLCSAHSIYNKTNALVLSQYLHDLGVVLHFIDSPILRNIMILNPYWTTNAVYKIFDDYKIRSNKGLFSIEDIINIFEKQDTYENLEFEILELMKKYELCYEVSAKKYLVPQMLPSKRPEILDFDYSNSLTVKYKYEFLPKGVLSRLMVRLSNYINNDEVWKSGMRLQRNKAYAFIEEVFGGNEIRISITGEQSKNFLTIIAEELDRINSSFENLVFEKLIPCNCYMCENSDNTHFYLFDSLVKRLNKGKNLIECENSLEEVSIRSLLGDVGFTQQDKDDVFQAIFKEFGLNNIGGINEK